MNAWKCIEINKWCIQHCLGVETCTFRCTLLLLQWFLPFDLEKEERIHFLSICYTYFFITNKFISIYTGTGCSVSFTRSFLDCFKSVKLYWLCVDFNCFLRNDENNNKLWYVLHWMIGKLISRSKTICNFFFFFFILVFCFFFSYGWNAKSIKSEYYNTKAIGHQPITE